MSEAELVKFTNLDDGTEPSDCLEGPSINGNLTTDNDHEVLELVPLDREDSGVQESSAPYSKSTQRPEHDEEYDGEADSLLQKVVLNIVVQC